MKGPYTVINLDDTSVAIEENGVRCFLFMGTRRALLVDTGFGTGDLAALVTELTDLPLQVVNTHADPDHIGGNPQFGEILMHPAEYARYSSRGGDMAQLSPLWQGDMLDIGGRVFRVELIPGHTPGSISLIDEKHRVLLAGDTVQNGNIFMFGPGRSLHACTESLRRLQGLGAAYNQVYACHGDVPLAATHVQALLAQAKDILAGRVQGSPAEVRGTPVTAYRGAATFLCDTEGE